MRTHGNPACSTTHLDSLDISLEEELEVAEDEEVAVAAVAAALDAAAAIRAGVIVKCRRKERARKEISAKDVQDHHTIITD